MSRPILVDEADFVIAGTGAGGATAARVLAASGASVLLIEEGPFLKTADRPRELVASMSQAFRDFGTQSTRGKTPMPLLQARCVGGSTAINSGIIWRMPDDVRKGWIEHHGLAELVEDAALDRAFSVIEDELGVSETPEETLGGNGQLMAEGARALGLPGRPMFRNTRACIGRAQCLQGCPGEARQSMDVSYVPRAIRDGARIHTFARARRVQIKDGRAIGLEGDVLDPISRKTTGRFEVRARKAVIVSASVVQTPVILRQSGLRGLVGDRLQLHPGAAVVGRFPSPVRMGVGATQGYEVPMRDRGIKLESLSLPPEMLAARIPGTGAEWQSRMLDLDHYAQWCGLVRMKAHGTVRPGFGGEPVIHYVPLPWDLERMREVVGLLCRMMFAAGAIEVLPGLGRHQEVLTSAAEVAGAIETPELRQADLHLMASHLFGTACAGSDPRASVVGPDLQSHDVRGLYVMDASVFPTNLGVNPQHSIMGVVWRAAERLANEARLASTGTSR